MKLSRRALRNEVRVLTAHLRIANTLAATRGSKLIHARRQIAALEQQLTDQKPTLAENIRLAHRAEVAETLQAQAEAQLAYVEARLAGLAAQADEAAQDVA